MKIAYSGTHGTGKTTSVYAHAYKQQIDGWTTGLVMEKARECPLPIFSKHSNNPTIDSQIWLFGKQIEEETRLHSLYDVIICDRSIMDIVAYSMEINETVAMNMFKFAEYYINTYDTIYFKSIWSNQYCLDDGKRILDLEFREKIEKNLLNLYFKVKYDVVFI